jgi:hypothetical protein
MYPSIPKNTYGSRNRSDLQHFYGGYTVNSTLNESDLPNAIYLTKGNLPEKKFSIRVDLPSKFIEIPLSMAQLNKWFVEIKKDNELHLKEEGEDMDETEVERGNTGYDEKNTPVVCTLTPSTYDHAGECVPSKEKCQYCYKYWCGKCGCGVSNYLSKCCW